MLKKKIFRNFLICILVSILPVSCDIQKRVYRPGYFVQKRSSLPDRYFLPDPYISMHTPVNNSNDSSPAMPEKENNPLQVHAEIKQLYTRKVVTNVPNTIVQTPPDKSIELRPNEIKPEAISRIIPINKDKGIISEPDKRKEYENLVLAFLTGAGFVLLISAARSGIEKYKAGSGFTEINTDKKTKQEIANMADRLDRCADRFANAKNERIELAARKVSNAINKCNDIEKAKKLEKSFHDVYLSPSQASDLQFITLNNLLSNDAGYGGGNGTLKPDVVTTTGGYYSNSAGSLSWTMGEPISETFSDGNNTITQGFQQGSYSIVSVNEVDQPDVNITVYPNPFTSTLNIKSDSSGPIRIEAIDMQGNSISTQSFENGQGQIDLSNLPEAIYLLRVYDNNGKQLKVFKIQKVE